MARKKTTEQPNEAIETVDQTTDQPTEYTAEYTAMRRQRRIDLGIPLPGDYDAAEAERAAKLRTQNECECGCGGLTYSRFVVGHDSRLKSALLARHDAGDASARAELVSRGWRTVDALVARAERAKGVSLTNAERTAAKVALLNDRIASLTAARDALLEGVA